ncbi:hypothetical protein LV84_04059 [Algoriphagus ratkowskyi]|uniref:Type I phosphodiesterase/nucleotide pyrophosphatase n=1 Tax=Algoriphagus ratkowskyi TaxID=57028 RepID=A0A2W7R7R7_9BACT|nr:hypothetical protein [Algoriphagus ratkowskyi]PZX50259.1 hypothetical protein LV84_04059 [Algoriphagus ratkowskyi]TXD75611.1 hypothetical protein ESW18_19735 [Algoriphagus ratkowskyi]
MKTILVGLNELNFEYIKYYISKGWLPNFKKLFSDNRIIETTSEDKYQLLEPWIQWVSITTGKTYEEHKVFRLGDIVGRNDLKQIFETIEDKGFTVGAVSPFNVDNRLKSPSFFAPDPWTQTKAVGSSIFVGLSNAVSQAVNDNAHGKLTKESIIALLKGILTYTSFKDYSFYFQKLLKIKSQVGVKAIILDKLLADTFIVEWDNKKPDFSNLFLNTGAHFQHHYMFNSSAYKGELSNPAWYCAKGQDPLFEILKVYDQVIGELMLKPVRLVVATGLHQKPHKHTTFYWRLKEHQQFLRLIGIDNFTRVTPRMSRDFLIDFSSEKEAALSQKLLNSYTAEKDNIKVFTVDNRGKSLFVELTYPNDIVDNFSIVGNTKIENFKNQVSFVAIKNGEHEGIGYLIDTDNRIKHDRIELKDLYDFLLEDFVTKNN